MVYLSEERQVFMIIRAAAMISVINAEVIKAMVEVFMAEVIKTMVEVFMVTIIENVKRNVTRNAIIRVLVALVAEDSGVPQIAKFITIKGAMLVCFVYLSQQTPD